MRKGGADLFIGFLFFFFFFVELLVTPFSFLYSLLSLCLSPRLLSLS